MAGVALAANLSIVGRGAGGGAGSPGWQRAHAGGCSHLRGFWTTTTSTNLTAKGNCGKVRGKVCGKVCNFLPGT